MNEEALGPHDGTLPAIQSLHMERKPLLARRVRPFSMQQVLTAAPLHAA